MRAYLLAVAVTAVAVGVRWLLDPWLADRLALVTLFPAVAVSVWYGGHGPALLAAGLGYVSCEYLFIEPRGDLGVSDAPGIAGLFAYVISCSVVIVFGGAMRSAQRRANEGRALLRLTMASIGDAIITTDVNGHVTYLNPVAESLTGWTRQDAAGQPLEAVFPIVNEQTRQPAENPVKKALREGVIVGLGNHTVLIARDGQERSIDDSAAPIQDEEGKLAGCVLAFRDITARRQTELALQRSEKELADFFRSASIGVHWAGPDGIILRANQAELDMLGYSAQEYIGQPIAAFHVDRHVIDDILDRLNRGETLREHPARLRARDGSIRDVLINACALFEDGKLIHTHCFTIDVTQRKQAEQAREMLAAIVATSQDAIISKTLDGIIRSWNIGAERLFGYTAAEAVGQSVNLIIPPELQDEERSIIERLRRGERVDHFDTVRLAKGGRRADISLAISPIRDDRGRVVGASKVARDIGERKQAEEALRASEERFRELANNIDQLVWTCEELCHVTWYNRRWYEYTGLTFEEMQGEGWTKVHDPAHRDRVLDGLRACAATGEPWEDTFPLRGKDGTYRWFLSRSVPIRDEGGRIVRWFGTNTDITEQLKAEEALREADRRKDEFLATLSHELRNPLAPIRNVVQMLLMRPSPDPEVRQAHEVIDRQVRQMARLLEDLLDVSRVSHNKLELRKEQVELAGVIQSAVETSRPIIDDNGHELTVSLPPGPIHLDADPVRLSQVFSNLLNNAAKYTEYGGHVSLTGELQGSDVAVSITDDGIGIAPEMLPRIFDMFSQETEVLERSQGGLGIGLALVKGVVELHGGRIEAHSEGKGKGSTFTVRLPLAISPSPQTPRSQPGKQTPAGGARHCILVADDRKENVETLAMLLKIVGHEVHTAYDGEEAIRVAEKVVPNVALLDIGMPKRNGYDTCRHIRQQPWGKEMTCIALTGWGQEDDRRRTQEAGFDHHIVKPVLPEDLLQLLDSLPSRRETPLAT